MSWRGPVRRRGNGFVIDIGDDEVTLITRLTGELRELLTDPTPDRRGTGLLARLFPTAYPDDAEMEAEYQRLMRDELVQSKLAALDAVDEALTLDDPIDEHRLLAVMQSINSIRLVLGGLLGVDDDPDADEVDGRYANSPEYALYGYLSWLLEWCVRALK